MSGQAVELALFCAELPTLRAALSASPDRWRLLDRAVDAARAGAPLTDLLRQLGIAMPDDVDRESDGSRGGAPTSNPLPFAVHLNEGFYRCPLAARPCDRRQDRGPGDPLPTCHVHGQAMRFEPI